MEKAYDLKDLALKLKDRGLPIVLDAAESTAMNVYLALKDWLKESAPLSGNTWDDMLAPHYDKIDALLKPQIDKINKKVDQV